MTEGLFVPVDLNAVSDDFVPVPEGMYTVQVDKLEPKASKAGNNMINVTFNIVAPAEHMGRKLFTSLVLMDKAYWKVKQFVKAAGIPFDQGGVDIGAAMGRQLFVKVIQETYDDAGTPKIRNAVDEFLPLAG